jgi:hypothetical protein
MQTVDEEFAFMNVTIEQLVDAVALHAKWVLECLRSRTEDTWMPQLAVFVKAGPTSDWSVNMYSLAIPFNEDAEKRAALEQIGAGIGRERRLPGFAIMSSEAWVSNQKAGQQRVEPRLDPKRREAIVVFGLAKAAGLAARTRMFISRGRKKAIIPSEFEPVETEGVHSRLLNYIWDGFLKEVMAVPCTTFKAARAAAKGFRN